MTVTDERGAVTVAGRSISRGEVEDFLYEEADILDNWRYDDWLALFEEGGRFEVPTTDYRGRSLQDSGSFVVDDYDLLKARVKRLKSRKAHAENPHSRTQRMITNVRIKPGDEEGTVHVAASFVVHRARDGHFDQYVGWYDHTLVATDEGLRYRMRRSIMVHEALPLGARLSFIL